MKRYEFEKIGKKNPSVGIDRNYVERNLEAWDRVAKPLKSLGKFERLLSQIGGITKSLPPKVTPATLLVYCADNGIVEEGVSQSGQEVTALCAKSIAEGRSCTGMMARECGVHWQAIDIGIANPIPADNLLSLPVRRGTRNFAKEPALTKEELFEAIQTGMDLVCREKEKGTAVLLIGEMGIGNTTTSAAVAASLLKLDPQLVCGRGAGLSDEGLVRKKQVITEAIARYGLYEAEVLTVLATVGGLDIAAMVGTCIGGALYGMPVILDGVISMVAAYAAECLLPGTKESLIPSHQSREPAAAILAKELCLEPVLDADMALGEGSGAVLMLSLLRTMSMVQQYSASFSDICVEQYQPFDKEKKV